MPRPVLVVSPLFPPAGGGLPAHTFRLSLKLAERRPVSVLTSHPAPAVEGLDVRGVIHDWHDAAAVRTEISRMPADTVVLWQYVPHMYGRGGVNGAVPAVVGAIRRTGRRQAMIAHEIRAPFHWKPHWFWYALMHRVQWRRIRRSLDVIAVSTEGWLERWRDEWRDSPATFLVLPSAANIPVVPVPPDHRAAWRRAHGFAEDARVMAYFGTLSPAKRPGWVLGAWRRANERIGPTGLAIVGGKPALRPPPGLEGLYREFGHLEDAAVSHALSAVDLMVLPFEDGVSERRSSASTSLAHGVAVLTTRGESTGSTLRSARFLAMADASDPEGFREAAASLLADPARLHALGDSGREAYGRLWSWDVVADRLAPHLDA